jgi:hypothetical protein
MNLLEYKPILGTVSTIGKDCLTRCKQQECHVHLTLLNFQLYFGRPIIIYAEIESVYFVGK